MSEQAAVSAPGLPGATVIESGINGPSAAGAQAPASSVPAHVSDTSGMNETQAAAMRYVDSTRAELAGNLGNHSLAQRHREALNHALRGGPAPAWLKPEGGTQATHNGAPIDADDVPGLAAAYVPMDAEGAAHVRADAVLHGLPADVADGFLKMAEQAQLPQGHAKTIAGRLAHHYCESGGNVALSEAEHAEFAQEAARMLGGQEKYQQTVERARAFLKSAGLLEHVDSEMKDSTILYDPAVLLSLANLATARGSK